MSSQKLKLVFQFHDQLWSGAGQCVITVPCFCPLHRKVSISNFKWNKVKDFFALAGKLGRADSIKLQVMDPRLVGKIDVQKLISQI
jgi:hypothetical protein